MKNYCCAEVAAYAIFYAFTLVIKLEASAGFPSNREKSTLMAI